MTAKIIPFPVKEEVAGQTVLVWTMQSPVPMKFETQEFNITMSFEKKNRGEVLKWFRMCVSFFEQTDNEP